jgi:hypothetical protein
MVSVPINQLCHWIMKTASGIAHTNGHHGAPIKLPSKGAPVAECDPQAAVCGPTYTWVMGLPHRCSDVLVFSKRHWLCIGWRTAIIACSKPLSFPRLLMTPEDSTLGDIRGKCVCLAFLPCFPLHQPTQVAKYRTSCASLLITEVLPKVHRGERGTGP